VKGTFVEVKIGVQQAAREVVLESAQAVDDVVASVTDAVTNGTTLVLTDDKGRTVVVPGEKIAYVEIGAGERGRVGFGAV
jgi:Iap family predicted aminopeptidase